MNVIFSQSILGMFALGCVACSSTHTVTRRVGGAGELPPMAVTVRVLPSCPVEVSKDFRVSGKMNSQGFVDLQIPVRNPSSRAKKFRYSWQWLGPDGMSTTDPSREVWRTGFLEGRDVTRVGTTSTVADPSGVVLRLSDSP